jgi:hypothetical protein
MSGFAERHKGERLPPMGKKPDEGAALTVYRDNDLIPLAIQGKVIPVTEQEALGIIGQVTAILQSRRPGGNPEVFYNGER